MIPLLARRLFIPAFELAARRPTLRAASELRHTQHFSPERLREWQLAKLRALLASVLAHTDYAELAGVERSWLPASLAGLSRLPLLDKATLTAHRERLVNRRVAGGAIRYNTGGSSGQPLIFYLDRRRQAWDRAARIRAHEWFAVRPGDREAYLWGSPVELTRQDRLRALRDRLVNDRLIDAFGLSERSVARYVAGLRAFRPACLFGYPSSIALLARLASRAGLRLDDLNLRAVFVTAELLTDEQRRTIAKAFAAPVANGYGSREGGFIAHECPHRRLHVTDESVIVEYLHDGRPAAPGEDGEIVVTHMDNHAMPFIRYRTGDIAAADDEPCPCGRGLSVMRTLRGRTTDFIVTPDGRWVHGLAVIYAVRDLPGVREYQIVQEDLHRLTVSVVLGEDFPSDGAERIAGELTARLGPEMHVDVRRTDAIAPSPSGKHHSVISQVARDREAML